MCGVFLVGCSGVFQLLPVHSRVVSAGVREKVGIHRSKLSECEKKSQLLCQRAARSVQAAM